MNNIKNTLATHKEPVTRSVWIHRLLIVSAVVWSVMVILPFTFFDSNAPVDLRFDSLFLAIKLLILLIFFVITLNDKHYGFSALVAFCLLTSAIQV